MTIYGESAQGLASTEKISVEKAQRIIDGLMKAYPGLESSINYYQNMAKQKGYVETISGFRRRLGTVRSSDRSMASRALRQAYNAVVQGSGAYCTNTAMININLLLKKAHMKSLIVATVHDSVVLDVSPDEVISIAKICSYCFSYLDIPEIVHNPIKNLDVPDELKTSDTEFRFPLHGEVELGTNYNNDVSYDPKELKEFKSPYWYCKYKYALLNLDEDLQNKLISEEKYNTKVEILKENKTIFQQKIA